MTMDDVAQLPHCLHHPHAVVVHVCCGGCGWSVTAVGSVVAVGEMVGAVGTAGVDGGG